MRPQPESTNTEVLAGLIERVTYHNAENGFCVLRAKVRGHRDVVTVVGHAAAHCGGRVDHGLRRMGQRPHPRPAVQSALSAHIGPDFGRRHREVPLVWHDPGRWPGLRKKAGARAGEVIA
jgi:hypothetical protein